MSDRVPGSDPVRALVLSGGGGRGGYHVGVLRFLEEHESSSPPNAPSRSWMSSATARRTTSGCIAWATRTPGQPGCRQAGQWSGR